MFYVYKWFIIKTGEIFYIGKGCNNRYKQTYHRNKIFNEYLKKYKCKSEIIKYFSDENKAFEFEKEQILYYKSKNLCKANLDCGGTGGVNFVWTDEMRNYKSIYNPMKDQNQRERMKKNNPMSNPEIVKKVSQKKRKPVIINNNFFQSVKSASIYFNVSYSTITKWCRQGYNYNMQSCYYVGEKPKETNRHRYNKGGCRELLYCGEIYESPIDLANKLGLHHSTICKWAKKGFDTKGNVCRYTDDKKQYTYKKYIKGEKIRKPIKVNGILYASISEAEQKLGLKKGRLAPYIAGTRKSNKFICEYVNQQPSHGKSDCSTVKGSTTNE